MTLIAPISNQKRRQKTWVPLTRYGGDRSVAQDMDVEGVGRVSLNRSAVLVVPAINLNVRISPHSPPLMVGLIVSMRAGFADAV